MSAALQYPQRHPVSAEVIRVFREAGPGGYRASLAAAGDESVASIALPESRVAASEFF
jgi:hypothetical protein